MTKAHLLKCIKALPSKAPVTQDFESLSVWRNPGYKHQKEHWQAWLAAYHGPGAYNRENSNRSAEFIYNHIQCAPMLVWLNEATGAPPRELKRAIKLALVAKSGAGECAAIRKVFPWERVVKILVR